ncbi:helix-turn-helix transcriptional regulator [Nioella sp. MMSF_3534]|uniref:ArsR/SmtB family transcription factor n=1 Tax=Nioella sp. MMSF_3534 TaxID=3046720 RepID=UPI00273EC298|nr:helix-turn-helix transcriptional regulator [Nioella sp. MMSF_3534]
MKDGPDIARIAALIGDPARANMLTALMSGKALTATELAAEAGVTLQTASAHLAKLEEGGLLHMRRQGRHKYASLASDQVAETLEALMGLAAGTGHLRTRTGPRDQALREARICYDHLAGDMGILLYDRLLAQGWLTDDPEFPVITDDGAARFTTLGLDIPALQGARRPICRACLDWSERRSHLAGGLGQALLDLMLVKGWARRLPDSRVIRFSPTGKTAFHRAFPAMD